ncbi:MAG: flagellar protein FliL [Bdellovibrionales bacterium CG10_big_fil_rev_8_21_14_0_10_45_34]|nr:MAG: flagellar protein FliL [Bdellovibrionales bacterium CG10_big_fil_rev_8_21_14_0_10_45_34]
MAEQKNESTEGAAPKKNFGVILKFGFLGLNIIAVCSGLGLTYMATMGSADPTIREEREIARLEQERNAPHEDPVYYTMPVFTVNLDGIPRRILRTQMTLELLNKKGFEEVVGLDAKTRDSIVRILNSKSFHDVEPIQGKLILKHQVATQLNSVLNEGVVVDVFFEEFIVQ